MKLTDEQIIKALECCMQEDMCDSCPIGEQPIAKCFKDISTNALDLIKRLQAENDRLKGVIKILENDVKLAKSEARRGFAERLKGVAELYILNDFIDNTLKEMEQEDEHKHC